MIRDYKGEEINADVIYAVHGKERNDYVKLDFDELRHYAEVNRRSYADVLANTSMVNISD